MSSYNGRSAVVTGAGSGIGRAVAVHLSRLNINVVLVDIDGSAAEETASLITGPSHVVEADISCEQDVERYLDEGTERFGAIQMHHLNAGIISSLGGLPNVSTEEFDRVMAVNVRGAFLGIRGAMRRLESADLPGSIVVTTSIHGLRASSDLIAYQVSKHALVGLVQAAAMDAAPWNVRVNGIAPGIIPTPADPLIRADMQRRAGTVPMRRSGEVNEIADAVGFLLSDASTYITGQILSVDGGASIVNSVRPSGGAGSWDPSAVMRAPYSAPNHS